MKKKFNFVEFVFPFNNDLNLREKIIQFRNKHKRLISGWSDEFYFSNKTKEKYFDNYCLEVRLKHEATMIKLLKKHNINFTIRRDDELIIKGEGISFPVKDMWAMAKPWDDLIEKLRNQQEVA